MNRSTRARWAKDTINNIIPRLLMGDALANSGVAGTAMLQNLPALPPPDASYTHTITIRVWHTDTLTAAQILRNRESSTSARVAILNMASCMKPGGGVLTGASAQEEFLCARSTLYPALRHEWYRLPMHSVIYTRDCLVFRDAKGHDLPRDGRYHVDVVSAAMLRRPELTEREGKVTWEREKDLEDVIKKVRYVMRALVMNGVKRVVLGAWGCGAYGNPTEAVADIFKNVLLGTKRGKKEEWTGIEEIVFAITDLDKVNVFKQRFPSDSDDVQPA